VRVAVKPEIAELLISVVLPEDWSTNTAVTPAARRTKVCSTNLPKGHPPYQCESCGEELDARRRLGRSSLVGLSAQADQTQAGISKWCRCAPSGT
jgi:hypothetical protein